MVFFSLEMEKSLVQTKIYYYRKYIIIATNVIRSETYFISENRIKI